MNAIRRIRCQVFGVNQAAFAKIAGVRQPTVSRWERDDRHATLAALGRIRAEAQKRGLEWRDSYFFELPPKPQHRKRAQ